MDGREGGARDVAVRLFGDVAVVRGDLAEPVTSPGQRLVLALLAVTPGRVTSVDAIHAALWPATRPARYAKVAQMHISRLRRILEPGVDAGWSVLRSTPSGYVLDLPPEAIDVLAFEAAATLACRADGGEGDDALDGALAGALGLWGGDPLTGIDREFAAAVVRRLEVAHAETRLRRLTSTAAHGDASTVVLELEALHASDPCDERVACALVDAYRRTDRTADALRVHAATRRALADDLGVDPGEALGEALLRVLRPAQASRPAPPPREQDRLIGRAREVAAVRAAVVPGARITVVGAAGVGKTRVALAAARAEAALSRVRWVRVSGSAPGPSLETSVLRALGGQDQVDRSSADGIVDALVGVDLLVLDGCDLHLDAAVRICALLAERAPMLAVIVTCRSRLRLAGELAVQVGPLDRDASVGSVPDAVALFERHLGAAELDDAERERARRVCALLDGNPLAITLAAARASALGVDVVERGLESRFDILTTGRADVEPQHRSLRAALEWSHALLPAPVRDDLESLAAFAATFGVEDAAAVAAPRAGGAGAMAATLADLVDASLVERVAPDRFRLSTTMRAFAGGPDASGEVAARHAAWVIDRVRAAGRLAFADPARCRDALVPVLLDAEAAGESAHARGDAATVLALAAGPAWDVISAGRMRLQRRWSQWAVEIVGDREPESDLEAQALLTAGALAGLDRDDGKATALLSRVREHYERTERLAGAWWCDYWWMATDTEAGRPSRAVARGRRALAAAGRRARESADPTDLIVVAALQAALAESLAALAIGGRPPADARGAAASEARLAQAQAHSQESAALGEAAGLAELVARARSVEVVVRAARGDVSGAHAAIDPVVAAWRDAGRTLRLGLALVLAARVAAADGDRDRARSFALEALGIADGLGWWVPMRGVAEVAAWLAADESQTRELAAVAGRLPSTHRWAFRASHLEGAAPRPRGEQVAWPGELSDVVARLRDALGAL
ncbi:BTAD domain-containing putative transcriptional regulator [Demequina sp. NBRC 110056]|uniref:BTAD domain-containing putative transcriptional regulator n=1 Tax=Demequina sp. NBRC 110056 TaxID=1570345 RepID=UPI0013566CDC|nr:BTAD domain-containing putative transcriptional regulator [Demequina sp. NBRC 110056]